MINLAHLFLYSLVAFFLNVLSSQAISHLPRAQTQTLSLDPL